MTFASIKRTTNTTETLNFLRDTHNRSKRAVVTSFSVQIF